MKTIIDKKTGFVIYCAETFELNDNEIAVDELPTLEYDQETQNIYWDFKTKQFYIK